jgi:hypothetical protein
LHLYTKYYESRLKNDTMVVKNAHFWSFSKLFLPCCAMLRHMAEGAPKIVRVKLSTQCIYLYIELVGKMMLQWSTMCIFDLFYVFYATLPHAA